jgi:membrane associated rhomboid family serine protease
MFFAVPIGNGVPLRSAPLACALLVVAQVAVAAWTMPRAERQRWERACLEREAAVDVATAHPARDAAWRAAHVARGDVLTATDPFEHWGYRDGDSPRQAVTALFLHADALHLLANVVLLAILGAYIEQAWGAAGFLLLFLAGGAVSLHLDAAAGPPTIVLGASGGVAALLGAYCVVYRRHPIRWGTMHLVFLRPHFSSFHMPCIVLGIAWMALQAIGWLLARRAGDDSIAFLSHLVGFGSGAAVASMIAIVTASRRHPIGVVPRR